MDEWLHTVEMDVRDSDIDFQGVVANHVYQQYFGHANNLMIKAVGFDIIKLHQDGFDCVIARVEIDYNRPLFFGDRLRIDSKLEFKGSYQVIFIHRLIKVNEGLVCAEAKYYGCVLGKDGPVEPTGLKEAKEKYIRANPKTSARRAVAGDHSCR